MKNSILIFFIFLSSCSFFDAEKIKNKNASLEYLNYGVEILEDLKIDKIQRYEAARDAFAQSIKLDPKNKEAKVFYKMILRLLEKEKEKNAS